MLIDVDAVLNGVDFSPSSATEEILQNVRTILTTPRGTVPLLREFGVSREILDEPLPTAQAKYTAEIINAVEKWEPRAKVTHVKYSGDGQEGKMAAKVQVKIDGA